MKSARLSRSSPEARLIEPANVFYSSKGFLIQVSGMMAFSRILSAKESENNSGILAGENWNFAWQNRNDRKMHFSIHAGVAWWRHA
jgi:hypothetical protein